MTQGLLPLAPASSPRHSYTDTLIALFTSRPGEWIDGLTLARVAGAYAWRSRCSDARRKLQAAGRGTIRNKQVRQPDGSVRSLYAFEPAEWA